MILKIFTGLNVLLYYSYAYLYFFNAEMTSFKPVYWYMASLVFGSVYIVFSGRYKIRYKSSINILVWAIVLLLLAAMSYTVSSHPEAGFQTLISWTESMLLLAMFVFLFQDQKLLDTAAKALVIVMFVSVLINYYDFAYPGLFSKDAGRAAGMYENANISGLYLVLGMVLSVWVLPKKFRVIYCVFIASGVLVTFSRSSMILWALAMFLLAWKNVFLIPRTPSIIGMGAVIVLLAITLMSGAWLSIFKTLGVDGYLSDNAKNRIGGSFIAQHDDASESRRYVAMYAWGLFVKSPVIGYGLGSTEIGNTAVGAHNMYLRLAVEMGFVGFLIVTGLIVILWQSKSNVGYIVSMIYMISSFFTHNSIEQPAMQIALAMSVVGSVMNKADEKIEKVEKAQPVIKEKLECTVKLRKM